MHIKNKVTSYLVSFRNRGFTFVSFLNGQTLREMLDTPFINQDSFLFETQESPENKY